MKAQRMYTAIVGVLFLVIGFAAFVPALAPANEHGQLLFGIFQVNEAQTWIHIVTGLLALGVLALGRGYYTATYVKVFGVIYTLVALWGIPGLFGTYNDVLFGLIHVNVPTELLHIVVGFAGLYAGFMAKDETTAKPSVPGAAA